MRIGYKYNEWFSWRHVKNNYVAIMVIALLFDCAILLIYTMINNKKKFMIICGIAMPILAHCISIIWNASSPADRHINIPTYMSYSIGTMVIILVCSVFATFAYLMLLIYIYCCQTKKRIGISEESTYV